MIHSLQKNRIIPYDADLIYDVILDIDKYPDFLPWCKSSKILTYKKLDDGDCLEAELNAEFGFMNGGYISNIDTKKNSDHFIINITSSSSMLNMLNAEWSIKILNNNQSEISFKINFELKSKILNSIAGLVLNKASDKIITAFEERVRYLTSF